MLRLIPAVIALTLVGGIASASAQQARTPASRPQIILRDQQDIFRAPPRSPAARPDRLPPNEIGTPSASYLATFNAVLHPVGL